MRNVKITDRPYFNIMIKVLPNCIVRFTDIMDPTGSMWFTMDCVHTPVVDQFNLPDITHI